MKLFLRISSALFIFILVLFAFAWMTRGEVRDEPIQVDREKLREIEEWRDLEPEPGTPDSPLVEVDYPLAPSHPAYPGTEAPLLTDLVEQGVLPPVAERTGPEPVVMTGPDGTGKYGGSWFRIQTPGETFFWQRMANSSLVRGNYLGTGFIPHLAKAFEVNEDATEYTFHLRRGVRWSDGEPLTADDFVFWVEDHLLRGVFPPVLRVAGLEGMIEKIDDHSFRYVFPVPNPNFLLDLARSTVTAQPTHYMKPYHPEVGDEEKIEEAMSEVGAISPNALYGRISRPENPALPSLAPWILQENRTNAPYLLVRNPYYWAVDKAGRQLPYIDRVVFVERTKDYIPLSASQGGVSMQYRRIEREDYTVLMASAEANDYTVYHWLPQNANKFTLFLNQDRRVTDRDPSSAGKRELLRDKRFRQALSLSIDRSLIIKTQFNDLVEPAQIVPMENSPFYDEQLKNSFVEHDPERARKLLDAADLTERDAEGFRTLPDGTRLTLYVTINGVQTGWEPLEMIVQDWAEVGVRARIRIRAPSLFGQERNSGNYDLLFGHASAGNPVHDPAFYIPSKASSGLGRSYGLWFENGGPFGRADEVPGAKAPPEGSDLRRAMELFAEAQITPELEKQVELVSEAFDLAAENVWTISISNLPSDIAVVSNDMRNVPKVAFGSHLLNTPSNVGPEMFYFENPEMNAGVERQIQSQLRNPPLSPHELSMRKAGGLFGDVSFGFIAFWSLIGILVLIGLRKKFVLRRLMIMIPTMIIISVAVFFIIQLPPGSFIETKILVLEEEGDQAAIEQIEELRETFWLDEPWFERYARWSGLYWFTSFKSGDKGLLQGNFGRSMETLTDVNQMVDERLMLTMAVSAGTILFTWVIAFPIGVISAVRQYTFTDYFFTVGGFLGMCIPNFLLALLLSYWGSQFFGVDLTGLFSAEYVGQTEWTWGKFVDLLLHLWVPVVVLGTSGTLGMIRVMRNNLLDELKKPYVTTARAKGVRPFRLLVKYPIRMALNPFVSGIGSIFPALVSGGAIVAIVLSLPTVGPLLLNALMTEDFYLAASLLMVLSVLSVIGVLFSDILLMLLDPRIRMEKGAK